MHKHSLGTYIKGECHVCHSSECGVKDLIPNVSLNQTVKRILDPQHVVDAQENVFQKFASCDNYDC